MAKSSRSENFALAKGRKHTYFEQQINMPSTHVSNPTHAFSASASSGSDANDPGNVVFSGRQKN